ncbi:MAG TPA: hypothetical protein VFK89_07770 [Actinomycetota bacterium]|nr:hypothetical protein [Actinomycetota bacterium]
MGGNRKRMMLLVATTRRAEALEQEMTRRGWLVAPCGGPGPGCPAVARGGCTLRDRADAAVVYLGKTNPPGSLLPMIRCASGGDTPWVLAIEGRDHPPAEFEGGTTVGALTDAGVIADTIECLASET